MASIIRVKRSTGTAAPGSLNYGEIANTVGVGTHGNKGGRTFIGDNANNPQEIGGRYYTDLLSIAPGLVSGQTNPTTAANGFVPILDADNKVDQWNVDNLKLDGNTLHSTDTDGNIILDPNGTGAVVIVDDTFLAFGNSGDGKIEYDENGTDRIQVTGAPWTFNNEVQFSGLSTVAGDLYVGGDLYVADDTNIDELTVRNLNVTGISTIQDKLHLLDNDVAHFGGSLGDNGDLQITHSGSHSYIKDVGTGELRVNANVLRVGNVADNATQATFNEGSSVNLYFNNANKLQTRIDGVNITGTLETDRLLVTGVSTFQGESYFTGKMIVTGGLEFIILVFHLILLLPDLLQEINYSLTHIQMV